MNIPLRLHTVDWIEANVVTEEMVDWAIRHFAKTAAAKDAQALRMRRQTASRNIAIGIHCGSYGW